MFRSFEEALEWLDSELMEQVADDMYGDFPVVSRLIDNKLSRLPKSKIIEIGIPKKIFGEAREAINKSMGLLKVLDWDDYVKDMKADNQEPSEDDYYELLQVYADDFIEQEFDEDLKTAMEKEKQFEWRDEYDFKRKMYQYQEEIDEYQWGYEKALRENIKKLIIEAFSNELS